MVTVQVFIYFVLGHVADVTGEQMLRQISETVEITDSKAPIDSVFLTICELVQDRAKIRHHEMTGHLTADEGISFVLRLRIKHIEHRASTRCSVLFVV